MAHMVGNTPWQTSRLEGIPLEARGERRETLLPLPQQGRPRGGAAEEKHHHQLPQAKQPRAALNEENYKGTDLMVTVLLL